MPKAVLFDLDDTIFDHRYSRRRGLLAIRSACPGLARVPVEELEREHERLLMANYFKTLDGAITVEDAMAGRISSLCGIYGLSLGPSEARRLADRYRAAYEEGRRPVPGVRRLLQYLKARRVATGIISNGLPEMQKEKLRVCEVGDLLDLIVVSEEVSSRKPDQKIFLESLRRLSAEPREAVYIGDSWDTDIVGASRCGIRAIWLNRYGLSCPDRGKAAEINSYEPLDDIAQIIFKP